jgi:hypothetical protein
MPQAFVVEVNNCQKSRSAPPTYHPGVIPLSKLPFASNSSTQCQLSVVSGSTFTAPDAGDWSNGAGGGLAAAPCRVPTRRETRSRIRIAPIFIYPFIFTNPSLGKPLAQAALPTGTAVDNTPYFKPEA